MQHDPAMTAQAKALHPNWRDDDTILARLARNAAEVPDQVAMRERDHGIWQEYSWADYLRAVTEFAAGLEARGVKPGDVVMVIGDNRPNLYFAMLGAACLRAIPSPAYADAPTEELAAQMERERPGFFSKLRNQQSPKYMWIGCSDSRVPANQITGLEPGEVFVHRNVANLVVHSDLNALSTIQFAVERLQVEHVMVVGHYGCSGVRAALEGARIGLADNWLRHIQDVRDRHRVLLEGIAEHGRPNAMVELNVIEQVLNVTHSTVLKDAWLRGQKVTVHGWVYGVHDGLLQDVGLSVASHEGLEPLYRAALGRVAARPRPLEA